MAGVYHPRHPERTVIYRVLFHYFNQFLAEYESRFESLWENVYLIAGCSALSAVLCLFLVLDFSAFDVISPFQDVSGWKLQRIGRDF